MYKIREHDMSSDKYDVGELDHLNAIQLIILRIKTSEVHGEWKW